MIAAFDRYTAKLREALPRATDGRGDLTDGQDLERPATPGPAGPAPAADPAGSRAGDEPVKKKIAQQLAMIT